MEEVVAAYSGGVAAPHIDGRVAQNTVIFESNHLTGVQSLEIRQCRSAGASYR